MNISSNSPTFGASFVDNDKLRKVISKAEFDKETETLATKFANLPQKDTLEIVGYDYSTGSIYDHEIEVEIKNLTTGKTKVFMGFGMYHSYNNQNIVNSFLEKLISDAKEDSDFWSKAKDAKIINLLTGKK